VTLRSAQAAVRGAKRRETSADLAAPGESFVREFLQGAHKSSGVGENRIRGYGAPIQTEFVQNGSLQRDFGAFYSRGFVVVNV
jgi:hypothetical protein